MPTDVSKLGGAACGGIDYPKAGFYGENIIYVPYTKVTPGAQIEMAAKLNQGASLRIRLTRVSGAIWLIGGQAVEWRNTEYDQVTGVQLFEAPDMGRSDEETFQFPAIGKLLVEYFECGSTTPTGTKFLTWEGGPPSPF
jgi:hypothetical protein